MKKVSITLILGLVFTFSFVSCSGSGESIDPAWEAKIKTLLLEHKEWRLEWTSSKGYSGWAYITFEDRGNKLVANIDNRDHKLKCERKVTFTSEGYEMAGCRMGTTLMIFDSNDQRYPFKGEYQDITAKLKVL